MSGIPVYTQSPIRAAAKPTATTDEQAHRTAPQDTQATTTGIPTNPYPSAQPGARPPAPTGTARYAPLQPTPTTTSTEPEGPPAPQPGAFPTPLNKSSIPPPPRAGEKYQPPPPTAAPTSYPPQMGIPPPTTAIGSQPPYSSTSTTNAPSSSYPVHLPVGDSGGERRSLEHPPGYQQNTYASDLTPDQRRAHEANENSTSFGLSGSSQNRTGFEEESVWNTAKNWAQQAGEKLSAAEAEVWKKINKS